MPITILQITDTHIHDLDVIDFYGMQPRASLEQVINHARTHIPDIDYVVVTGDLTHEGGEAAAEHLKYNLQQFKCPVYVTPGNHDDAHIIEHYLLDDQIVMPEQIQLDDWQLLFVDSHVDQQVHGQISEHSLIKLNQQLKQNPKPALLFTHHPPSSINCRWLDKIGIKNGEQLLHQLINYPQLKAIIFGHIHQQFEQQWEHFLLLGSPSTCIQFKPCSDHFATDNLSPGYRVISLHSEGKLTSQVFRCPI